MDYFQISCIDYKHAHSNKIPCMYFVGLHFFYGHVRSSTVFVFSWKLDYEELKFSKRF